MARIAGLKDLQGKSDPADGDDDQNKYYVGGNAQGGGGSGLSVLGPPGEGDDMASNLVAQAQAQARDGSMAGGEGLRRVKITLWANGFSVDDGELRTMDDPRNRKFLAEMQQGRVPSELQDPGGANVDVDLEDKRGEEYAPPPKPAYVAYSGEGQSLGGSQVQAGALAGAAAEPDEQGPPVVDESQPTATFAIRLHTGKRLRAKLNLTHTVGHIRALIQAEGAGSAPYVLLSGYPPSQITDFAMSVGDANLNGEQITQKLA